VSDEREASPGPEPTAAQRLLAGVPEHGRGAVLDLVLARGKVDDAAIAQAIGDLGELASRDAVEARLAALFLASSGAATHEFARAATTTLAQHHRDALAMADRLTRTAAMLAEAMERRRRPAEQRIVVEQRVAVAGGGRAVAAVAVQAGGGGLTGVGIRHRSGRDVRGGVA
jgi:hypothetical protein